MRNSKSEVASKEVTTKREDVASMKEDQPKKDKPKESDRTARTKQEEQTGATGSGGQSKAVPAKVPANTAKNVADNNTSRPSLEKKSETHAAEKDSKPEEKSAPKVEIAPQPVLEPPKPNKP